MDYPRKSLMRFGINISPEQIKHSALLTIIYIEEPPNAVRKTFPFHGLCPTWSSPLTRWSTPVLSTVYYTPLVKSSSFTLNIKVCLVNHLYISFTLRVPQHLLAYTAIELAYMHTSFPISRSCHSEQPESNTFLYFLGEFK